MEKDGHRILGQKYFIYHERQLAFELCMLQKEEAIVIFNKVGALSAKIDFQTTRIRATAYAPGKKDSAQG